MLQSLRLYVAALCMASVYALPANELVERSCSGNLVVFALQGARGSAFCTFYLGVTPGKTSTATGS